MVDLLAEKAIPISKAPKHVPGRPHAATIWRWHQRGVRGVKLETFVAGGRRFTTEEAIERFIHRTTAAQDGTPVESVPCRKRQAAIEKAEAELEAAGI